MSDKEKEYLPIIGYGEKMIEPVTKKGGFGETTFPRSYTQARDRIIKQVSVIKETMDKIPEEKRMDEVVVTIRLNEKFLAKSYIPNTLFKQAKLENIGSRRWEIDGEEKKLSKMHFVKVDKDSIEQFEHILSKEETQLTEGLRNDIRKVEDISFLSGSDIVQGFDEKWKEGTVEFVLHPFGDDTEKMLSKFRNILENNNVNCNSLKVKTYPNGPTFVSVYINRKVLRDFTDFNPLRTVHPLTVDFFPELRNTQSDPLRLKPPLGKNVSQIKVGIFDGGIDQSHPLLINYAKENQSVGTKPVKRGVEHGTAVAGVVLYGDLNQYEANSHLNEPVVSVESFRVLPKSNPEDLDLYEAIDFIEEIVPTRNDINVYNLSFGPAGPILDDEISRFTFSLDQLAWDHKKLFVVAVGNDGHLMSPYNRVQAPADIVNGLGVGAYTFNRNGEKVRATYSCVGGGREGCKVKPDIVAFGGDRHFPIHLLSVDPNNRCLEMGTSFSSPLIASKAAEILGRCNQFNTLVARALLVHSAQHPNQVDSEIGYGIVDQSVDDILRCDENHVTIIYSSSLNPTAYAKLPIPLPVNANINGQVNLSWTIATLSKANPLHIEDYTESAIEDTFYPHHKKYKLTKNKKSKTLHIDNDSEEIVRLIEEGWVIGSLPSSSSTVQYQTEQARRGELKWDTIVKKWKNMRINSLERPSLVLHGMGRNGSSERMDYAAIISISVPKYKGNLHEDILNEYNVLEPVFIRNKNEIMVPIR
ncbi:S8 family peptidase [Cytobacillus oceanisediminis]|uniref:S8 family peptidase n=1 Tax=Cytobacillus oceanisediminis TaxID=665099 RepID=UPI002495000D|nr:S8 family peptidase [Cytobacillus oceanisediminis]